MNEERAPYVVPDHYLLETLVAVRMLASLESSERWRKALPMLDDAIERGVAEKVSIGVSPIFQA